MKNFFMIIHSVLVITTSSLMAYPTGDFPKLVFEKHSHKSLHIPDLRTLSYDGVIDLLALIESDAFEDNLSMDELDQINKFISFLAMEGVTDYEMLDMANATASLFQKNDIQYALFSDSGFSYTARPAIQLEGVRDILLCKGWFHKQWDNTKAFVKKHKKAIIIGTIVVVTVGVAIGVAILVSSAVGGAISTAGLATAGGLDLSSDPQYAENKYSELIGSPSELLTSSLQEEVLIFKENVVQEQFAAASEDNGFSIEQNGRIIGSLFAHKIIDAVTGQFSQNPFTPIEMMDLGFNSQYPTSEWIQTSPENSIYEPHFTIDAAFLTDFATTYPTYGKDLNKLSYQVRGDLALCSEYYTQAMQDFGNAIALDPSNPILYLERGIANFELGNYENSISDYAQFIEKKGEPFCVTEFSLGFAKGVHKGAYDTGKDSLLFLADFIVHPIHTSKQVVDSLSQLAVLVKNDEFGVVAEILSPELHQLITQWDTLPSITRGELAGYALGKLGIDLMVPGVIAKVASKSVKSAKELVAIGKNIKLAQEILILETASTIGMSEKVAEVVKNGKTIMALGEDVGLTTHEIAQLKCTGNLESAINSGLEKFVSQSESDVYKSAISQNKHVKMTRDYLDKPVKEIQKGINSYQKQIFIHKDKIENPTKYYPDWDKLDSRQRSALINKKWPAEIKGYEEQRRVLESILKERLFYEG